MRVTVLYFAALRDAVGVERETCDLPDGVETPAHLRAWLAGRGGAWGDALREGRNLRAAVDQVMASADSRFRDGAEIALFPPVTGG